MIIGVDLGGTNVRAAAIEAGGVRSRHARTISARGSEQKVLDELFETIERVGLEGCRGIGCGVPSIVDVGTGVVRNVDNIPSWKAVPLRQLLEERYRVPARIANDANCFVLGEWRFGAAAGRRNVVGLTLGTGFGTGLVLDGRLYEGPNGAAGEICSVPYRDATIEHYCSGLRLERESGVPGGELHRRAEAGDEKARATFAAFGEDLGRALLLVLYAYDPEVIVLGGSITAALPLFEPAMRAELARCPQPHLIERLEIVPSRLKDVALLGAAALCLDEDRSTS